MKDTKKAADFIISIILIALSAFLYMTADKMPGATKGIGPGDYPKFICTILFILGDLAGKMLQELNQIAKMVFPITYQMILT